MRVPVPIRGALAVPLRMFGVRRSNMNPDICTICEMMFETIMRRRNVEVDLTILFADLRGYTALSQTMQGERLRELLEFFYDECAAAIWEQDGLLNKTLGDGVMAIFNFPLAHADHARRAVVVAREVQRRCAATFESIAASEDLDAPGIGIGIHTRLTAFGEFGRAHREITAVGSVVNLASRLQGAAEPGEIVVSREVIDRMSDSDREPKGVRECTLKGYAQPVTAFLM
jgi:class 3 adenylate cyclase